MFDVAPSELLIVAIIALVVIGPKDLPKALRFVGKWVGKARAMAKHFRSGLDTMMREAELEELEAKWRAQNEAIMRAHPAADAAAPVLPPDESTPDGPRPAEPASIDAPESVSSPLAQPVSGTGAQ